MSLLGLAAPLGLCALALTLGVDFGGEGAGSAIRISYECPIHIYLYICVDNVDLAGREMVHRA